MVKNNIVLVASLLLSLISVASAQSHFLEEEKEKPFYFSRELSDSVDDEIDAATILLEPEYHENLHVEMKKYKRKKSWHN